MSRNTGNKSATPHGSPLLTGILVGMVIGAGMAAGLAWYIMKSPSPFVQKEQALVKPTVDSAKPVTPAPNLQSATAASGVAEGLPRFEFYKVLTDKQEVTAPPRTADKQNQFTPPVSDDKPTADNKQAAANEPYFLQAGSFSNVDDADKLKARLAMLGVEAYIQTAAIPDKGVRHRVRVGPYINDDEMKHVRSLLKQNGVDTTPIRAQ